MFWKRVSNDQSGYVLQTITLLALLLTMAQAIKTYIVPLLNLNFQ